MAKIYLENENKTREIGYKLGKLLKEGSVICLVGDLGAGKTTMLLYIFSQIALLHT